MDKKDPHKTDQEGAFHIKCFDERAKYGIFATVQLRIQKYLIQRTQYSKNFLEPINIYQILELNVVQILN